jgi:hypothetical protein
MTTATAQAWPNIAFIKFTLAKLCRTDSAVCFGAKNITSKNAVYRENLDKTDRMGP